MIPAMKPTTGFFRLTAQKVRRIDFRLPPISLIITP